MDLYKAIVELRAEKKRLDDAIEALERSLAGGGGKRGRVWDSSSRRAAAERMRSYWEKRRTGTPSGDGEVPDSSRTQPDAPGESSA
ncbi:MAG: hypothetical protein ACKV22_38320 [Bryobacteraceae bacterium]